jgi:diguanylate cyclase (GGDEF)-like protein
MGSIQIKRAAVRASMVTGLSIIVSVAIGAIVLGGPSILPTGTGLVMCVVCPLLIAWPSSAFMFWQKEKLRAALEQLSAAHRELAEAHRRLAEKARRDDMTGLLNREAFFAAVETARIEADKGTLLIIDADNFKQINDNHGHLAGDSALLEISAAIQRAVRNGDIVGRIGGEEFAVFLVGADPVESLRVAERVRAEVAGITFRQAGARIPLSVSVGGAMHGRSCSLSDLLREADRRLYEAKRRGRNRVICTGMPAAA